MSQASIFPTASVELDRYYYVFYSVSNKNKNAIHMRLYDHNRNLVSEDTRTFTTMSALEFLKKATANNAIAVGSKTTSSDVDVAFFEAYQQGWNNKQQLQIMSDTNKNYPNVYSNANVIYDISSSSTQYLIAGVDKKVLYLDEGVYVFDHSTITDVNDEMKFRDTVENGGNDYNQNIWLDGIIGTTNAYKVLRVDDNTPDLQYYTANGVSGDIFILHNRLAYYVRVETNHLGQSVFSMATSLNGTYHWQPKIDFDNKDYFFHMVHTSNANTDFVLGTTIDNSGTAITDASYLEINGVPGNKGANEIYDLSGYPTPSALYYFEANTANMGYQPHPTTGIDYSYNVTFDGDAILLNNALAPTVPFSNGKTYLFLQNDTSHSGKYLVFSTTHNDFSFNSTEVFSMGMPGYTGAYTLVTVTSSGSDLQYYKAQYYDASGIYKPDYQITSIPAYIVAEAPFSMTVEKYLATDLSYSFNFKDLSGALTSASTTFTETPPNTVTSLDFTINGVISKPRVVYDNPTIYTIEVSGGAFYLNGHEAPRLYVFGSNPYIFDQTHVSNGNKQIVFTNPSDGSLYSDSGYSAYGTAGDVDGYSTLQFSSVTDVNYGTSDVSGNTISYVVVPDYEYRVRIDANILGEYVYSISETGDDSFSKQVDLDLSAQALYYFDTSEPSNALKTLTFGLDPDSSDAAASLDAYTTYSLAAQGTSGAYVILDLRTYVFPTVTIDVPSTAYSGVPFNVRFTNDTFSDFTYSVSGENVASLTRVPSDYALTKRTITDVSFTFDLDVSSGTYDIIVDDITASIALVNITKIFVVTVGQLNGSDAFLIDGVSDADLVLENGKSYAFDLSYSESYTFGLATDYDGANNSAYTNNIVNTSNHMIAQDVSASSTLYYYAIGYQNMGKLAPQWFQKGGDIYGQFFDDYIGNNSINLTPDGNTIVIGQEIYKSKNYAGSNRVFQYSNTSWSQKGSLFRYEKGDGYNVAISADGNTVLHSSVLYPNNGWGAQKGFAAVTTYANNWTRKATILGTSNYHRLGDGIGISANGDIVAISTSGEDNYNGRIRMYSFNGSSLTQLGSTINGTNKLGSSLSLSSDGNVVAAICGGNQTALVYKWNGTNTWVQRGSAISNARHTALSSDGTILAVSKYSNNVSIYSWDNNSNSWNQLGSDITMSGDFGYSLSLSSDGTIFAAGAPNDSNNGSQTGSVRVFILNQSNWAQIGDAIYGVTAGEECGTSVSLSSDGLQVAVSSPGATSSTGLLNAGMVRIFEYK